jgi:hypothetical protein
MLTTPRAILLGLGLIAVTIGFQPMARYALISPAYAQRSDSSGVEVWLGRIATALQDMTQEIQGIRACRG